MQKQLQLVLHEGLQFSSQTLHLAGNAFKHCKFDRCTLVITNAPAHFDGCQFSACNWRIEYDVLHGDPGTVQTLHQLLQMIAGGSKPPEGQENPAGTPANGDAQNQG